MMKKKVLALTLAAFVACGAAGCGGEEKKPAPKPENKQTTNVKKDEVMKLPHVAKYDKISKDAYPNLKWGSTGYSYKDYPGKGKEGKGALLAYGEVIAGFHRTLASDDRPTFKLDDGREVKGSENYDIEVLVGGCKGNCVIEATSTYTKRMDPASYKKPHVEKKVLVPFDKFDKTYVRHDENGKKWVTHEKCGTK